MKINLRYISDNGTGKKKFIFRGNPVAVLLIAFVFYWLGLICYSAVCLVTDAYFPYEGEVLAYERYPTDYLAYGLYEWGHLVLKDHQGERVVKVVSFQTYVINNIHQGEYVVKKKGFGNNPETILLNGD